MPVGGWATAVWRHKWLVTGVFAAALFTTRGNTASVLAALIIGAVAVLLLQPYMLQKWLDLSIAWPWWWVIVTPISFAICIVPPSAKE